MRSAAGVHMLYMTHSTRQRNLMMQAQLHLPLSYSHLSLSILKWVPMCQGFNNFSGFLHNFLLAKLANISVRVKLIWTDSFVKWSDKALLEMARADSHLKGLAEIWQDRWIILFLLKWLHNAVSYMKKFQVNYQIIDYNRSFKFLSRSDKALLEMARVASFGRNLKESLENLLKWLHNAEVI